jgi:hypothetical protein
MQKVPVWVWLLPAAAALLGAGAWYLRPGRGMALPPDNLFANAGFESGAAGWTYPAKSEHWAGFKVDRREAHSGRQAAHLPLEDDPGRRTLVWGVMQEVRPRQFPHYLAGFYRVNDWEQGTPTLYLQTAVIVWLKRPLAGMPNFQVRFLLGGISYRPTRMENVRYIHFSTDPPARGQWVPFAVDLWEAFKSQWGYVPQEWDRLNVFFEVRYDDREKVTGPVRAEAFYDDLYLGQSLPEFAKGVIK